MPIARLTSKGQMTIPKEIRKTLNLKPSEKVIIVVEGDQAIIKPLKGDILNIGGSIRVSDKEKPVDFHKVREEVKKTIAKKAVIGK
ncbi:MAG TPA: AbrB/MazE/SpoVT family DNA-binding domain-containing protein [Syntrophaceae bacterium]|nr:AbrB/MazE/SpoVT family DNA-binding domain-containing protein [Syntrophaceae bacterium]